MLERMLSPRGRKIYTISIFLMLAYAFWLWFTDSGIVARMNQFQAQYIFSGYYYPELTIVLLAFPITALSFMVGLLYDFIAQQGIFTDYENSRDLSISDPSLKVEYQEATRADLIEQTRQKYQNEIRQLKMLGFDEFGFYREIVPWLGIPVGFMGILGSVMLAINEVVRIGPNLTVNAFYALMASRRHSAYASISKMGIQFRTEFTDGTLLASSSYSGIEIKDDSQKIYSITGYRTMKEAWVDHQKRTEAFIAEGKEARETITLQHFFSTIKRTEEYILQNTRKLLKESDKDNPAPSCASIIISGSATTIIVLGILGGFFLSLLALVNLVSHIYPSCWFMRNLHSDLLPLQILAIPVCVGTSWVLARFRHTQMDLITVDGMGTRLYENEPTPDGKGFIATKWLVLGKIPLLPVKSYALTIKGVDVLENIAYDIRPLDKINWAQVKATIFKAWLWYLIFIAIYIAFAAWSIAECI